MLVRPRAWAASRNTFRKDNNAGGCAGFQYGMSLEDAAREDDIVLESDWGAIYLAPDSAAMLNGTTVDFTETVAGKGFNFENPNAEGKCSCGKSFS